MKAFNTQMGFCRITRGVVGVLLVCFAAVVWVDPALAGRYGIYEARDRSIVVFPPAKKPDRVPLRQPAPILTQGALCLTTPHFRIFWGDNYHSPDPEWAPSDNNGIPVWIDVLATALENAYGTQVNLGFSTPYGVADYYLDVYVANTGVRVEGVEITLSSDYYAFTDIDTDYDVSYFVFNNDFSAHTDDALGVLRATAAHELFHAVQRVDYPWDDNVLTPDERFKDEVWWFEATATWMETVCEPDVDDYIQYIQAFLAQPHRGITYANGKREYGAAMFAGYLWLEYGGPRLWQDIFKRAFEKGVEQAIQDALSKRNLPSLEDVVARFWTLSGHPENTWPDGARFLPDDNQSIHRIDILPHQSELVLPERFGARLFRFSDTVDRLEIRLDALPLENDVKIGLSLAGSSRAFVLQMTEAVTSVTGLLDNHMYLALVNTGDNVSDKQSVAFEDKTIVPGDFNNNRKIDLEDMILVFQYLTGSIPESQIHLLSDVNEDKKAGIIDNVYILQKME